MTQKAAIQKTTRISITAEQAASAGPEGTVLVPPAYGIGSLDSGAVFQRQTPASDAFLPNPTGLPDRLKSGVESLSGLALDDVRVHFNSTEPANLQALAYTQGTEIYLAPGQERHLPHEAWHVIQQAQGRVKPTMLAKGLGINDDRGLEQEAEVMGAKAVASDAILHTRPDDLEVELGQFAPIQRYPTIDGAGRMDALIYAITTNDQKKIIYVGQTTDKRAGDRFVEHATRDKWAPWYYGYDNYYDEADESKWPYRVHSLENLKDVTKFETTVAEQWWLEKLMKDGHKLLNDSTPCSVESFEKRAPDNSLYNPKNIQVSPVWKPSLKAKGSAMSDDE